MLTGYSAAVCLRDVFSELFPNHFDVNVRRNGEIIGSQPRLFRIQSGISSETYLLRDTIG